jgi:hypothetical protein
MYTYKSHCRFNLLVALQDKILEIRPGEIIESPIPIEHCNLNLIEEEKPKKVKPNADKTDNR